MAIKKCIILILISFSVTYGQMNILDLMKYQSKLAKGDTVKIMNVKKNFILTLILLSTMSIYGQIQLIDQNASHVPGTVDNTSCYVPSNVRLYARTSDSLLATCTLPSCSDFHMIYWKLDSLGYVVRQDSTTNDSVGFENLAVNQEYIVFAKSMDDSSNFSDWSDSTALATATTLDTVTSGGTVPAPVTNVYLDTVDNFIAYWTVNPPNGDSTIVQVDGVDFDSVGGSTNSYSFSDTTDWINRSITITVRNNAGRSDTTSPVVGMRMSNNTYYFDYTNGNDANSGTDPHHPFKTINKYNTLTTTNKKIVFKNGETWTISIPMLITNSYTNICGGGTGNKPIITRITEVGTSSWTSYSTNIYYKYVGTRGSVKIQRAWIDGTEALEANGLNGDNGDGTTGLTSLNPWWWDKNTGYMYIYATSNPSTAYSSIELPSNGDYSTVSLKNDYIILDGLELRGGHYGTIMLNNANHIDIRNCKITMNNYYCIIGSSGLIGSGSGSSGVSYINIHNDTIDTGVRNNWHFWYDGGVLAGIGLGQGANNFDIYNNTFLACWNGVVQFATAASPPYTSDNWIHHNIFKLPQNNYTQESVQGNGSFTDAINHMNMYVFDNFFDGTSGQFVQVAGGYFYFFENICRRSYSGTSDHAGTTPDGVGIVFTSGSKGPCDSVHIFNNTFFDMNNCVWLQQPATGGSYDNNIGIKWSYASWLTHKTTYAFNPNSTGTYYNNCFWSSNYNSSSKIVYNAYTLSEFNSTYSLASGNIQPSSTDVSSLMDTTDFSLPVDSPLKDAAHTLSAKQKQLMLHVMPDGFYRIDGTEVLNSSGTQLDTDLGAGTLDTTNVGVQ